jgi:putative spermidine/putrescine transport system permease protein
VKVSPTLTSYLQIGPLLLLLLLFFGIPLLVVIAYSFFQFDGLDSVPAFDFVNYVDVLTSEVTLSLYLKTLYYAVVVWAITLLVGFIVAYFLAFHVQSLIWQMALLLLCTVPFWTSNIIRMISWIPFLGRNGIFNNALIGAGMTDKPLEFLLFSDFAVIIAYVHLFTLFMIVPIFNAMARIDKSLIGRRAMAAPVPGASSGTSWCRCPRRVSRWDRSS